VEETALHTHGNPVASMPKMGFIASMLGDELPDESDMRALSRYFFLLPIQHRKQKKRRRQFGCPVCVRPLSQSSCSKFHADQRTRSGPALGDCIHFIFMEQNRNMTVTDTLQKFSEAAAGHGNAFKSIYEVALKATEQVFSLNTDFARSFFEAAVTHPSRL
jgi:hypothetical protein